MITQQKISKSSGAEYSSIPSDVYQVQIIDVEEREGVKYNTVDEKIMQFMFKTQVVEGEHKGAGVVIFTSKSWFDGGKSSKPSKLYNLLKAVYGDVSNMEEISDVEINGAVGKQIRVTVELTDNGKNKVTGFLPAKAKINYEVDQNEFVDVDDVPL